MYSLLFFVAGGLCVLITFFVAGGVCIVSPWVHAGGLGRLALLSRRVGRESEDSCCFTLRIYRLSRSWLMSR